MTVATTPKNTPRTNTQTSLQVDIALLNNLMTLAGELVLSRNQLLQAIATKDLRGLEAIGQRIDMVTSELQERIMRTRMQTVACIFDTLTKVVRDASQSTGIHIDLQVEGKNVELDKTILEAIENPLCHLVRQTVRFGFGATAGRNGTLWLKASHENGQVNIELRDNGRGIDMVGMEAMALEQDLVTRGALESMSATDRAGLMFMNGFKAEADSYAHGMADVKAALDTIGGTIEVAPEANEGGTVRISLPLTLAIIPSQIIGLGTEKYAIPQANLSELLRIPADQVKDRIEKVGDASVIRLRGRLLPLVDLAAVMGVERTYFHPADGRTLPDRRKTIADRRSLDHDVQRTDYRGPERRDANDRRQNPAGALNIAVVVSDNQQYGLIVGEMNDAEEIVVKPLGSHFKQVTLYAGATIMGDGKTALILDIGNVARAAGLTADADHNHPEHITAAGGPANVKKEAENVYLLFRYGPAEQFAVPLDRVDRIEKIKTSDIEQVGGRQVLRHGDRSIPLVSLDQVLPVESLSGTIDVQVIHFVINGKPVGLLACPPVDAASLTLAMDDRTLKQPGVIGSAVINAMTTLILDIDAVAQHTL